MSSRFGRLLQNFYNWAIGEAEEQIPVEQRLDQDLQEKTQSHKEMQRSAIEFGAYAEKTVKDLAMKQVALANMISRLDSMVEKAKEAAEGGKVEEESAYNSAATRLAGQIDLLESEIDSLEQQAIKAQKEWGMTKEMIVVQSRQLKQLAKDNMEFVARARQVQMRQARLDLQESVLRLSAPGDVNDVRSRMIDKIEMDEARVEARSQLLAREWQSELLELSTPLDDQPGLRVLEEARNRAGYTPKALPSGSPEDTDKS